MGKSACELGQTLLPLSLTLHTLQNVHRDTAGAPGILPVLAWTKKISFSGFELLAPPKSVRKMSRIAPAINNMLMELIKNTGKRNHC